jgi:hypothetical protein
MACPSSLARASEARIALPSGAVPAICNQHAQGRGAGRRICLLATPFVRLRQQQFDIPSCSTETRAHRAQRRCQARPLGCCANGSAAPAAAVMAVLAMTSAQALCLSTAAAAATQVATVASEAGVAVDGLPPWTLDQIAGMLFAVRCCGHTSSRVIHNHLFLLVLWAHALCTLSQSSSELLAIFAGSHVLCTPPGDMSCSCWKNVLLYQCHMTCICSVTCLTVP